MGSLWGHLVGKIKCGVIRGALPQHRQVKNLYMCEKCVQKTAQKLIKNCSKTAQKLIKTAIKLLCVEFCVEFWRRLQNFNFDKKTATKLVRSQKKLPKNCSIQVENCFSEWKTFFFDEKLLFSYSKLFFLHKNWQKTALKLL